MIFTYINHAFLKSVKSYALGVCVGYIHENSSVFLTGVSKVPHNGKNDLRASFSFVMFLLGDTCLGRKRTGSL